jgi:hypothetical protein
MTTGRAGGDRERPAAPSDRGRPTRLETLLLDHGLVKRDAMREAKQRQAGAKRPLIEVLLEQQAVDERALTSIARESGLVPLRRRTSRPTPRSGLVPADVAQRLRDPPAPHRGRHLTSRRPTRSSCPRSTTSRREAQMPVRARLAPVGGAGPPPHGAAGGGL